MNFSTYYGLNLAEGSDIVNPLIIDVPNYEKIDEVMHDNATASVGLATELLTGTVHALVRSNDETAVFRFIATANFTAGDTFTVDGVQVTALLPTGEPLGTGAYVINANVLCILTGTLLTMYVPSGAVAVAEDSNKLGGELPSYYGTASDVNQANLVAQAAGTLANQVNSNLTALDNKVDNMGRVMLWENLTPNAPFVAQTITLSDNTLNYDYLIIGYTSVNTVNGLYYESISYERRATRLFLIANAFESRNVSFSDNTAIFGDNYKVNTYAQTSVTAVNSENVPLFIWGVKNK